MRLILSYCKSHVYDLHSILAGTITFLLMFFIKKPVKALIEECTHKKALQSEKWNKNKAAYTKMWNGILIPITMLLAFLLFEVIALISPLIHSSVPSALMSGAISLAEYAVFDQLCIGGGDRK